MADNTNEYGNKMLNGDGLLHLVGTIKAEIANAGGTVYTAGTGISISEDGVISLNLPSAEEVTF